MVDLKHPPQGRFLPNGLQWFGWTCLEDRAWVHTKLDGEIPPPLYSDEKILAFVRTCNAHRALVSRLSPRYTTATQTPLCFEVKPGTQTIDLDLKSRP